MDRRQFLQTSAGALLSAGAVSLPAFAADRREPTHDWLPRWRGFNLLEKFTEARNAPFVERDFEWMAEWGFDFVRLPLSYRCWSKPDAWKTLDERVLAEIDQAVEFGRKHGIHVSINFHRAPGYCVNSPAEPMDLWTEEEALEVCAYHWAHFARRYKGIPNAEVSFDLLNEPKQMSGEVYFPVARRLCEAIRAEDAGRLIIADGSSWGNEPVPELIPLKVAQSTRGYQPFQLTHYRASWVRGSDAWPVPTWPIEGPPGRAFDKERLRRERIAPWVALRERGVGVHVGEWGAFQHTPHDVVLRWMADCLSLWKEVDFGWALWNFRGSFGILDSNRQDVDYEDFRGRRLDRKMLDLLRAN